MSRDAKGVPAFLAGATSERFVPAAGGKMIPCNGIHILPARSEPVAMATRARAGECRCERRRTKRDPWGALQGAAARATPRVAGAPACERGRISRKAEQRALGKPRPFGRGFPCLKQTIALLFQVTSWHRKKSTYTQWSQSHPMHRAPAPARHRPLGRSRFHNTPALQSHR